jgi:hypothetical protein
MEGHHQDVQILQHSKALLSANDFLRVQKLRAHHY